jgi:serine/threonine protein kinase
MSELVLRWQQERSLSAEELCAGCPELLDEVRRQIDAFRSMEALLATQTGGKAPGSETPTPSPEAAAASGATDPGATVPGREPSPPSSRWGGLIRAGEEPLPGFQLVSRLGKGGFGEVWKARGPGGVHVALKLISLGEQAGKVELRALQLVKNLRHVNLLTLFGIWQTPGFLIIAMELADRTLLDRFEEVAGQGQSGIPWRELLKYAREAAAVLDYLNKPRHFLDGKRPVGIQHCDIKPQNLLLVGDGVKVGDFGLARVLGRGRNLSSGLTPAYAPPEFFRGQTSRHSDQYALAVTYCHLRGGKLPFRGDFDTLKKGHLQQPPDLTMLPGPEQPAVARALAKEPKQRWPNCRAFVKALAEGPREQKTAEGKTVGPGYTLTKCIGSDAAGGGIWRALAPGGIEVAIRVRRRTLDQEDQRELQVLEQIKWLRHPYLLQTHDYFARGDRLFIVMELADGNLRDRQKECRRQGLGGIPLAELVRYLGQAAEALDFLRSRQVLHHNVKPDNILLVQGIAKLADFSLARLFQSTVVSVTGLGTPAYMAPETWASKASEHSDQYSLAVAYAEMRLDRRLFAGDLVQLMTAHLTGIPDLQPLPEAEQQVLLRALAKKPEDRYPDCISLVRELEAALDLPTLVRSVPIPSYAPAAPATAETRSLPSAARRWTAAGDASPSWRAEPTPQASRKHSLAWVAILGVAWLIGVFFCLGNMVWLGPADDPFIRLVNFLSSGWLLGLAGGALILMIAWKLLKKRERPALEEAGEVPPGPGAILGDEGGRLEELPRQQPPPAVVPVVETKRGTFLEGHSDSVWGVAFSPDSRRALSGSMDNTVRLWDVDFGQEVARFVGHTDGVTGVAISPDGRFVLSSSLDDTVLRWDVAGGQGLGRLVARAGRVFSVAISPDGRHALSGHEDTTMRLWEVHTGREVCRLAGHGGWVRGVAFSPDGRWALSGSEDTTVRLWEVATGRELRRLEGHTGPVQCVAFSPDGGHVVSGSTAGDLRLWEAESGRLLRRLVGHTDWVRGVAFAPDGGRFASASDDETVRLWDARIGEEIYCFQGHSWSVLAVAFAPDGRSLVSGSDDATLGLWPLPYP